MIHVIVALIFSFLIYLTGNLVSSLFFTVDKQNTFAGIFIKYAIGSLFLLITYAIIITGFKTIYTIALLAILIYLFLSKTRIQNITDIKESFIQGLKKEFKGLLILQTGLILFIAYQYFSTGYIMGIKFNAVNEDISYYITLAEYLSHTGIENKNTFYNDFLNIPISGIAPYHYFDLYISSFLFKAIFFLNNMEIYNFIFLPYCYFLIFLSFVSVFEVYLKNKSALLVTLGIIFTFYVGYFPASSLGIKGAEFLGGFGTAPFKYTPSYVFLALLWLFYLNKSTYKIALLISILPILSIIYLFHAPVLSFLLALIIYSNSKFNDICSYKPLLIPIITIIGIGVIYYLLGEHTNHLLISKGKNESFLNYIDFKLAKTVTVYGLFKMLVFFIPLYFIVIFSIRKAISFIKDHFLILLALTSILVWGLIGHAFYQTNDESWQLDDIFFMPVMKIGLAILIANSIMIQLKHAPSFRRFSFVFPLVVVSLITINYHFKNIKNNRFPFAFSQKFIDDVKPYSYLLNSGVVIVDTTGFQNSSMKARPSLATYGGFAKFIAKKSAFFSISVPTPNQISNFVSAKIIKENIDSPMGQFYLANNDQKQTMEAAQINFIKKNNISCILSSKQLKLPQQIQSLIESSFHDYQSNQVFYILKSEK